MFYIVNMHMILFLDKNMIQRSPVFPQLDHGFRRRIKLRLKSFDRAEGWIHRELNASLESSVNKMFTSLN